MNVRELLHLGSSNVPVSKGANPIVSFQDEVNRLFSDFFGDLALPSWGRGSETALKVTPAMDVVETDKEFKLTAELPGMDVKDVQITVANGYVTIKGEKKQESKEEKEGYFRQERVYGSFQRVISLPDTANFDKAEASFSKGLLTIAVPKNAGAQTKERKIDIKQAA